MTPIPAYRAKRDENEREVIEAFQLDGFGVVQNSARGVWDLLVYDKRGPSFAFVEVKSKGGKLTPDQERWSREHPLLPKYVARSDEDAREIARHLRAGVPEAATWDEAEEQAEARHLEALRSPKEPDQPA